MNQALHKPKTIFLDAGTLNWDDVNFHSIEKLGDFSHFAQTTSSQTLIRARQADVLITNKVILNETLLAQLPQLKLICVAATGYNVVDIEAAKKRGIAVCNVSRYSTVSVAEHTLMLLLSLAHRLSEHNESAFSKKWSRSPYYLVKDYPFAEVSGKTLGIVGYGNIGKAVAKLSQAFGLTVLVSQIPGRQYKNSKPLRHPLKTVLRKSDFVSLHCPLTDLTHHLINKERLQLMKPSAFLLNLARGPVVDEKAVILALQKNKIAGFATDVLSQEPPPSNHPLFQKSLKHKVLLTPHIASMSVESRQRLIDETANNIESFLKKKKRNRIV